MAKTAVYFAMKKNYLKGRCSIFLSLWLTFSVSLACESQKRQEPEPYINAPSAIITSVIISPQKAYKGIELNSLIQTNNHNEGSITYRYQWLKNGQEIVGENKSALMPDRFQKGDLIRVKVTPSDEKSEGPPFLSSPVKILNSPPIIQEVWIEPKQPSVSDNLTVNIKSSDADGDFVYCNFQWEKNGQVIPGERAQVLERGRFKKGDSITVAVIPDDGEIEGPRKRSAPLVILNSPPIITSSPPTSAAGTTYQYQVRAFDPDDDPITFTLKSGPREMAIDKNTGLIQWAIRKQDEGIHSVEIEATDNEGARSIQQFLLLVDLKSPSP